MAPAPTVAPAGLLALAPPAAGLARPGGPRAGPADGLHRPLDAAPGPGPGPEGEAAGAHHRPGHGEGGLPGRGRARRGGEHGANRQAGPHSASE
jgi:hypothetical protein